MTIVKALSDSELAQLHNLVLAEMEVRQAAAEITRNLQILQSSTGITIPNGRPWVQPTGAHDAYTLESTVVHKGHLWESDHPFNVWEPGTGDLWIDKGEASEPDPLPLDEYPAWEPDIAVKPGDPYVYEGVLYLALQAHKTQSDWTPDIAITLWKKVD